MISDKAKRLLKKVQALSDNLSDQGTVSTLERDLLLSYLRDLYDDLSNTAHQNTGNQITKEEESRQPSPQLPVSEVRPVDVRHVPSTPPPPPSAPPEQKTVPEPVTIQAVETPSQPHVPVSEPVYYYPPASGTQSAQAATAPRTTEAALAVLFEQKATAELSEKLKLQPIERIEHGMGINERMLAINELFNGDGELFRKTLEHLNALTTFDEAQTYLTEGVATQFQWGIDTKKAKASYFIQLVRRRYVRAH